MKIYTDTDLHKAFFNYIGIEDLWLDEDDKDNLHKFITWFLENNKAEDLQESNK